MRPQDRRALSIGAMLATVLLGYGYVVRPAIMRLTAQQSQLRDERARLARERSLLASVQRIPHQRDTIASRLTDAAPRLFAGDSVAAMGELTSYITIVADGSQAHIASVEAHAPHTTQGITALAVDIRGEASWRNVLAFIHALESATRLVDIQRLRIERGARGGPLGGDLVSFSVTVAGYSRSAQ